MSKEIFEASEVRHIELRNVWEQSVRHSNKFYGEEEIQHLKPMLLDLMKGAVLLCIGDPVIDGFLGIKKEKVTMLYVRPEAMKQGIGTTLLTYTLANYKVSYIDVHLKNRRAITLYEKMGFEPYNILDLNIAGKLHKILQMKR